MISFSTLGRGENGATRFSDVGASWSDIQLRGHPDSDSDAAEYGAKN